MLAQSADVQAGGTGQAAKVADYASAGAPRLCAVLRVVLPRKSTLLLIRTFSGCDFLTPHKHSVKPKCVFCGAEKTTWEHLLCSCPSRSSFVSERNTLLEGNLRGLTTHKCERVSSVAKNTLELWRSIGGSPSAQTKFLFGCCCTENDQQAPLRYLPVLAAVMKTTATLIARTQEAWQDKLTSKD